MPAFESKFSLNDKVLDPTTGIKGTIVAVTFWTNGCTRYLVQPKGQKADGGPFDASALDEGDITLIKAAPEKPAPPDKQGGPRPAPKAFGR